MNDLSRRIKWINDTKIIDSMNPLNKSIALTTINRQHRLESINFIYNKDLHSCFGSLKISRDNRIRRYAKRNNYQFDFHHE